MGLTVGFDVSVSNVVDDWLILAIRKEVCVMVWQLMRSLLKHLGFTVNEKPHKLPPPAQVVRWIGLQVDTVAHMISLPADKLQKARAVIAETLDRARSRRSVTRRQVDRLIGYLSFCATVVYGGRAFLHRMREVRHSGETPEKLMPPHHRIHLNQGFVLDLLWWQDKLSRFNGMVRTVSLESTCDVRLDATGLGGLGIFVDGGFVEFAPGEIQISPYGAGHPTRESANDWELFNFVVLMRVFGSYLANRTVVVDCDNACSVSAVRKFRARSVKAEYMAATVRTLFGLCVRYNVRLKPRWIAGKENVLPDALSRQYWRIVGLELTKYIEAQGYSSSPWVAGFATV